MKGLGADLSEENSAEGPLVDMEQVIGVCDLIIREATEGIWYFLLLSKIARFDN